MKTLILFITVLALGLVSSYIHCIGPSSAKLHQRLNVPTWTKLLASNSNEGSGRRRKRVTENSNTNENKIFEAKERTLIENTKAEIKTTEEQSANKVTMSDGTTSLEDLFGLNDQMLGDLDIDELPVPREDLVTGKTIENNDEEKGKDDNKVFQLPDLTDFMKDGSSKDKESLRSKAASQSNSFKEQITQGAGSKRSERRKKIEEINKNRVDRRDQDEYMRVMQLNPFADADDTLFMEEVINYI